MDASLGSSERADLLVPAMTLEEKVALCHGSASFHTGYVPANARLGIPALVLSDGPSGARVGAPGSVTCFASPITLAATWNGPLAEEYGRALGAELKAKGTNIVLAPMMNMLRVPQAGRNWEGFGEDPFLTATIASAEVRGIQDNGILACAKHFIANEQETFRDFYSSVVDDRILHEIYMPPFRACVEAGVGVVMGAYNKVDESYACENSQTLETILYGELGFEGFVVSDWYATHSTVKAANSGLTMQMPDGSFFGEALISAVRRGKVSAGRLDEMAKRILVPLFAAGLFDRPPEGSTRAKVASPEHAALSREIAAQGLVLLKKNKRRFAPRRLDKKDRRHRRSRRSEPHSLRPGLRHGAVPAIEDGHRAAGNLKARGKRLRCRL
jgi:beta-glucosidase